MEPQISEPVFRENTKALDIQLSKKANTRLYFGNRLQNKTDVYLNLLSIKKEYFTIGRDSNNDYIVDGDKDEIEFQQALDDIDANGGGKLVLTNINQDYIFETYKDWVIGGNSVFRSIHCLIPNNCEIIGANRNFSKITSLTDAQNVITFGNRSGILGAKNITLRNLTIRGSSVGNPTVNQFIHHGLIFFCIDECNNLFENLIFSNYDGAGMEFKPVSTGVFNEYSDITIRNVHTDPNTVGAGIAVGDMCSNILVDRYTGGARDSSLAFFQLISGIVRNCNIYGNATIGRGRGIELSTTANNTTGNIIISDSQIHDKVGDGIALISKGANGNLYYPKNVIIANNRLYNMKSEDGVVGRGIFLAGTKNVIVNNNLCYNNASNGIELLAGGLSRAENNQITNNNIFNNCQEIRNSGLFVNTAPEGRILNNLIKDNKVYDDQSVKTQNYGLTISMFDNYNPSTFLANNRFDSNDFTRNSSNNIFNFEPLGNSTIVKEQIETANTFINNY